MSLKEGLLKEIKRKKSFLCIGLDTDITKIPSHLLEDDNPVLSFNRGIIEATKDLCVSYKINTAFYEAMGPKGWQTLEETLRLIPDSVFSIADAKRGDIGNTGKQYAKAFFESMSFDSVTVAPYMGKDSVDPFLGYDNKMAIVLGLTSNKGSEDLQMRQLANGKKLYEETIGLCTSWGSPEQLMLVIGATHPDHIKTIRGIAPEHFYLVPGVGAQGGNLADVCRYGLNEQVGLLINVSRGIIYAGNGTDYAEEARKAASDYQLQMAQILESRNMV